MVIHRSQPPSESRSDPPRIGVIPMSECFGPVPTCSGIYALREGKCQRLYVGSAMNLRHRLLRHRMMLRAGNHNNQYLQNTYNKLGEQAFHIEFLEFCEVEVLLDREQFWMAITNSMHDKEGFNLAPIAGTRRGVKMTDIQKKRISDAVRKAVATKPECWKRGGYARRGRPLSAEHIAKTVAGCSKPFRLISPSGEIFSGKNRALFCRCHGLHKGAISRVILGSLKSYKGWKSIG